MYRVTDDSGFIGIFDPHAYVSFVDGDWTDELASHFIAQMYHYRLLLWATGCEETWRVDVRQEASQVTGFREYSGSIVATENLFCLTSYDSLTMGAQFEDVSLPQENEWNLYITVEPGAYHCRVIQLRDPNDCSDEEDADAADFVIELVKTDQPSAPWNAIPGSHGLI